MKIKFMILLLMLQSTLSYAYQNYGIIEIHELGYIAGNSMTENYDYVALFCLKNNADIYRAMSDIEKTISNFGDVIFKIGAIDNFIILSIQSNSDNFDVNNLSVKFSHSTRQGRLCRIFSYHNWNNSDLVNKVMFGEEPLQSLCIK